MKYKRYKDVDFNKLRKIEENSDVKAVLFQNPDHIAQYLLSDDLKYRQFPGKLYKYLPRQFAENLINNGEIKLGTFDYYRINFKDDAQRQDVFEAKKIVPMPDVNQYLDFNVDRTIARDKFTQQEFPIAPDLPIYQFRHRKNFIGTIQVEVKTNKQTFLHADSYLYCLSKKKDIELSKKFNADVCVEIFDPQYFFSHIAFYLNRERISTSFNWGNCSYKHPLDQSIDYDIHEYMVKDYKFKDQEEYRFVFIPFEAKKSVTDLVNVDFIEVDGKIKRVFGNHKFKTIRPFKATIPDLKQFCKIVDL